MTCSRSEAFCDWLDVTCSPELSFVERVVRFLDFACYPVAFSDADSMSFRVGDGILRLDTDRKWHRASASGAVLSHLRLKGEFLAYLSALSEVPHTITRLDAAVDTSEDFPCVLAALRERYASGYMAFSRKSLRITELLAVRSDGERTGTWYAGHRAKAMVTARVYDKQNEILERTGVESPSRTRYELTFRKGAGVTLRDACMPASLFYQHSEKLGLSVPAGVEPWQSHDLGGWSLGAVVDTDFTLSHFARRVETSPEIQHLAALARRFGPAGNAALLRAFERALTAATFESGTSADAA